MLDLMTIRHMTAMMHQQIHDCRIRKDVVMIDKTAKGSLNGSRPVVSTCGADLGFASQYDLISGKFNKNSEPYKAMARNVNAGLLKAKQKIDTYVIESKAGLKSQYNDYQSVAEETAPTLEEVIAQENIAIEDGIPYYADAMANPSMLMQSFESMYRASSEYSDAAKSYDELFSVAYHCDDALQESVVAELDKNDFGMNYQAFSEAAMLQEAHDIQNKFRPSKSGQPRITGQSPNAEGEYENECVPGDDWSYDEK